MERKIWIASLFIVVLLASTGAIYSITTNNEEEIDHMVSGCTMVDKYWVPEGYPQIPSHARFLGTLRGTWYEMGYQYGERAADLIFLVTEVTMNEAIYERNFTVEQTINDLTRFADHGKLLAPEMYDMIHGIADGAAPYLEQSDWYPEVSNYIRVLLVNHYCCFLWYHPGGDEIDAYDEEAGPDCSGFGVVRQKKGSKNTETLIGGNRDTGTFFPLNYYVAYVAIPSDPEANKFWAGAPAGFLFSICMANEKGVGMIHGAPGRYSTSDWGISSYPLGLHAIAYADNADEALELMTVGSPEYRAATGRKTVLRGCGLVYIIADPNKVLSLEYTAHRYAVRYPGDMGEVGNFIQMCAGYYYADYSYDENNEWTDFPMSALGPETPQRPNVRGWTRYWQLQYNDGTIDRYMAFEFNKAHYIITQEGTRIDWCEEVGKPWGTTRGGVCRMYSDPERGERGGTTNSYVVVLDDGTLSPQGDLRVTPYWVQCRPCEWEGPWDYVNLWMHK